MMADDYWRAARYVKHYDGDTVTLLVDMGFHVQHESAFRVLHIDTPELRGEERPEGLVAKQWVADWMAGAEAMATDPKWPLMIQSRKSGKYGRWLATIFNARGQSMGQGLIDAGLADPYL